MFVRAQSIEGTASKALMVPASGVSRDEAGRPVVLVLDGQNKVQQRKIKTSRLIGSLWLVTDGLAAGACVIVQGMEKAIPGATVKRGWVTAGAGQSAHPIHDHKEKHTEGNAGDRRRETKRV